MKRLKRLNIGYRLNRMKRVIRINTVYVVNIFDEVNIEHSEKGAKRE